MNIINKNIYMDIVLEQHETTLINEILHLYLKELKEDFVTESHSCHEDLDTYPEIILYDKILQKLNLCLLQFPATISMHLIEFHYLMICLSLYKEDYLPFNGRYEDRKIVTQILIKLSELINTADYHDQIYLFEDLSYEEKINWLNSLHR